MRKIEKCRKTNRSNVIIAYLSIIFLVLAIIATCGVLIPLAYFIVQIWKWKNSRHATSIQEQKEVRNGNFTYLIYDQFILSENYGSI